MNVRMVGRLLLMGCVIEVIGAIVLFVLIGLIAGEARSGHGSASVQLTTIPTVIFVAILLAYYFGVRRPAKRRRER
jgi:uncharacterized membrane protein